MISNFIILINNGEIMKKLLILLSLIFVVAIINSCDICSCYTTPQQKYPAKSGNQWEYQTAMTIEYYDSLGNIESVETLDFGNTVVKIESENDTVNGNSNLVLFTSYDLSTPENIHKSWYSNSDSGLFVIAYSNAGSSQPVLPKGAYFDKKLIDGIMDSRIMQPTLPHSFNSILSDSILYFVPRRKALEYPLKIGSRWVELVTPFYRERFIDNKENIEVPAGTFNCYKIESDWDFDLIFTDHINLRDGLIRRIVFSDSAGISTPGDPDPTKYARITTLTELIGKNF